MIESVLDVLPVNVVGSLDDVLGADAEARSAALQQIRDLVGARRAVPKGTARRAPTPEI